MLSSSHVKRSQKHIHVVQGLWHTIRGSTFSVHFLHKGAKHPGIGSICIQRIGSCVENGGAVWRLCPVSAATRHSATPEILGSFLLRGNRGSRDQSINIHTASTVLYVPQTTCQGGERQTPRRKAKTPQNRRPLERVLPALLVTMHGPKPTVKDIELDLAPEAVPLLCNEQLDSSDEEDCVDVVEPAQQAYRVVTMCTKCGTTLRLVVESSEADIRAFQELLLRTLKIVCPSCA